MARPGTDEPIPLRAHAVLCLLGWRGRGYSPAFVRTMDRVEGELRRDPRRRVHLLDSPGTLCAACPHATPSGCTLAGETHEENVRAQDRDVLSRLGLEPGAILTWQDVLGLVARRIHGVDLASICTTCPWRPLGWCAEGVEAGRTAGLSRTASPE
ncbi:MAG: DUF1284 domain-containing protein [Planctomycetota bacterium]